MNFYMLIVIWNFLNLCHCNDNFEEVVNSEGPPLRTMEIYNFPPLPFTLKLPWPTRKAHYFLTPPPSGHHLSHQHHHQSTKPTGHPIASHTTNNPTNGDMISHRHHGHHHHHHTSAPIEDKQHLVTISGTKKPSHTEHKSDEGHQDSEYSNSTDHSNLKESHSGRNVTSKHHEHIAWNSISSVGDNIIMNSLLILLMCKLALSV